jgi:hypothetical protein
LLNSAEWIEIDENLRDVAKEDKDFNHVLDDEDFTYTERYSILFAQSF